MRSIASPVLASLLVVAAISSMSAAAQSWPEARDAVQAQATSGNPDAAVAAGDAYIDGVRAEFGESSEELADALLRLADTQMTSDMPGAAAENIRAAIPIIETAEPADTDRLVDVWIALGEAHAADDRHALAIDAWESAIALSRRELGLLNDRQVEIRWLQSQSALADDDAEAATRYREESRSIAFRSQRAAVDEIGQLHGTDSREYVDAMLDHARWLASENASREARLLYEEILEAVESEHDGDPDLTVRVWREFASTIGTPNSAGSRSTPFSNSGIISPPVPRTEPIELERAARILNYIDDPDPLLQATVLRDLADWDLELGNANRAQRQYRQVRELLDDIDGGEELARQWFEGPIHLRPTWLFAAFGAEMLPVAPNAPLGRVELSVTVDTAGRARDVRVLSADPEWMAGIAVSYFGLSSYRPRITDGGEPVAASSRMTWTFRYDPMFAEVSGLTGSAGVLPVPQPPSPGSSP